MVKQTEICKVHAQFYAQLCGQYSIWMCPISKRRRNTSVLSRRSKVNGTPISGSCFLFFKRFWHLFTMNDVANSNCLGHRFTHVAVCYQQSSRTSRPSRKFHRNSSAFRVIQLTDGQTPAKNILLGGGNYCYH